MHLQDVDLHHFRVITDTKDILARLMPMIHTEEWHQAQCPEGQDHRRVVTKTLNACCSFLRELEDIVSFLGVNWFCS